MRNSASNTLTSAVAVAEEQAVRDLLQSVVDVARAIFGAAASSIFLLDEEAGELVFQAVSGEGAEFLVGNRIPADTGIAGWVVNSGQAMVADQLTSNKTFARNVAESTGYVPSALMAAPLLCGGDVLGVIEVLDPAEQSRSSLGELDLLSLFAAQAAAALRLISTYHARLAEQPADDDDQRLLDAFREFLHQQPER